MTIEPGPPRSLGFQKLFAAISVNMSASVVTAVAGLGTTAFMARRLQVQEFGGVMLLLTAVNAFAIFEGLRPVIIHRVAAGAQNSGALFRAAVRVNQLMVALTLFVLAGLFVAGAGSGISPALAPVFVLIVVAFFGAMQYQAFLEAEQDTIFTGVSRSVALLLLYFLLCAVAWFELPLLFYTFPILISQSMVFLIYYLRFRATGLSTKYRFDGEAPKASQGLLAPAVNNIVFNACAVTINVADRAIIGSVMGAASAGLYAGPSELSLRAVGLVRTGMQVALPWASRLSAESQLKYWLSSITIIILIIGSGASAVLLQRDLFVSFLLGEGFRDAGDLLGIFVVGILFSTIGYACMVQLNARGDFTTQRRAYSVSAAVLVVGASWGAYQGHLVYVAVAYLLARSVDLVIMLKLVLRCGALTQAWFFSLSLSMFMALTAAWHGGYWETATFLAIAYGIGYASLLLSKRTDA